MTTLKRRNLHLAEHHMKAARRLSPSNTAAEGVRIALERSTRHDCPSWDYMRIDCADPEFEVCTCNMRSGNEIRQRVQWH